MISATSVQGRIFDDTQHVCAVLNFSPSYFVFYNTGRFEAKIYGVMRDGTYSYFNNILTLYWGGNKQDFTDLTITTNYGQLVNLEHGSTLYTKDKCN